MYIDTNNLYGHSMSQPLPYDEIKLAKDICKNKILNTPDESDIGYFIEVDLTSRKYKRENKKNFHLLP